MQYSLHAPLRAPTRDAGPRLPVTKSSNRILLLVVALAGLAGCGGQPEPQAVSDIVETAAIGELLLSAPEVDSAMGATLTPLEPVSTMSDNRNLLPNLNCLGVWQVAETAIYGERGPGSWQAVRQQMLRAPDSDEWNSLVVQSVVLYESTAQAEDFLTQSAERWSECTDHRVNITLNDKPLPRWHSHALAQTHNGLSIPITRTSGHRIHSCQHVLATSVNVVIDVQACKLQGSPVNQAADIASAIEAKIADVAGATGGRRPQ